MDVYLDSPMAVDVTDIFRKHRACLDEETWNLINSHEPPLRFPGLHLVRGTEESKAINEMKTPSIIMSSAGMCNAGRIKHHLCAEHHAAGIDDPVCRISGARDARSPDPRRTTDRAHPRTGMESPRSASSRSMVSRDTPIVRPSCAGSALSESRHARCS